jgi:hypothetical protein
MNDVGAKIEIYFVGHRWRVRDVARPLADGERTVETDNRALVRALVAKQRSPRSWAGGSAKREANIQIMAKAKNTASIRSRSKDLVGTAPS